MKKRKLLTVVVSAVLSVSMLITGCGKKDNGDATPTPTPTENTPVEEVKIDADQTINILGFDFKTLDPSLVSDTDSFTSLSNVFEALMRETEKDGVVTNELAGAESVSTSDDKLIYTFKLRKDAKWTDGVPVKAQDYEFSWKRLIDPRTAADYMTFLSEIGVKGAEEVVALAEKEGATDAEIDAAIANLGVKAIDETTLEVTLAHPVPYFLSAMSFSVLVPQREDKFKELGSTYGSEPEKLVYNGPFVVSEYAKGSKIVYAKNEKYWNASAIKLEKAVGHMVEEPATITNMFIGKELDVAGAAGDDLVNLTNKAKNGEFKHFTGAEPVSFYLYFNVERGVLKNPKIRRALSLALDRQQYMDVVFQRNIPSFGVAAPGLLISEKDYRKEVAEPLKGVTEDAKALFAEGLKEEGITDVSTLKVEYLLGQATTRTKMMGEYLQKVYKDAFGFDLVLNHAVDSQAYFKERQASNFDIVAGGWGADYNDVHSMFYAFLSTNPNNNGKYNNPKYDKLVKEGAVELDTAKRIEMYKEAERLLVVEDAAVAPTHYRDIQQFRQNYIQGFYIPKFGGNYSLYNVYVSVRE